MGEETPGIIETLKGNRKTKIGVVCFIVALVLGFAAVYVETGVLTEEGNMKSDIAIRLRITGLSSQRDLLLDYDVSTPGEKKTSIRVLDKNREVINTIELDPGENTALSLSKEAAYLKRAEVYGNVSYVYTMNYSRHPFGLLAIPALLLTIFGVVTVYKGFNEYMKDLAGEEKGSNSDRQRVDQHNVDFMGLKKERDEEED